MTAPTRCCSYEVHAQVGGKLAQLGARLVDASAKQMADAFFDRFSAAGGAGRRPPPPMTPPAATRPNPSPRSASRVPPRHPPSSISIFALIPREPFGLPLAAWIGGLRLPVHPVLLFSEASSSGCTARDRRRHRHAACRPAATSPTWNWPPRCTWRWRCAGRCSWKASPAPARPRSPRCSPPAWTAGWCGCNATTAWTSPPPPTNGTTPASSWRSASPRPPARPTATSCRRDIYTREFLLARPLLSAIDPDLPPAVLLIDELDRADEPFEAFLLELLADFQITVPEYGTVQARTRRWWC